jgi:RNA polymerase sigma-70 factor (ECF subfamily)
MHAWRRQIADPEADLTADLATAVAADVPADFTTDFATNFAANFEGLVRLYWPRIYRFALASLRDRDACQSVAQDCFLKAYRARQSFRGEASPTTWLTQIAVNLVRDHARNRRLQFWKRAASQPADSEVTRNWVRDKGISPERRILVQEQVDAVWIAAARLPERQRTAGSRMC